jgi:hypothetical protein
MRRPQVASEWCACLDISLSLLALLVHLDMYTQFQFTCFTRAKVKILMQTALLWREAQPACEAGGCFIYTLYIYMHIYVYIYVFIYIYVHANIYIYTYVCVYMLIYVYIHARIHTLSLSLTHTHTQVWLRSMRPTLWATISRCMRTMSVPP